MKIHVYIYICTCIHIVIAVRNLSNFTTQAKQDLPSTEHQNWLNTTNKSIPKPINF